MRKFALTCALLIAPLIVNAQTVEQTTLDEAFGKDVLIISTANTGCFKFDIHVAVDRKQQQRGLMFIRKMSDWNGMLFVYRQAGIRSMWMKNTYIPLDILFAREDGAVSSVIANTEPQSLASISAIEPVHYVLELNAGVAERLGIGEGSQLIFSENVD
jgi:uncharacterized membrane protein (UPF0127 family)